MKKLLLVMLLLPSFCYSQKNAVFESIRVDTIRVSNSLIFEDNIGTTILSVGSDDIVHIQDTVSFLMLVALSQLANEDTEVEIGDNLLVAILIIAIACSLVFVLKFG